MADSCGQKTNIFDIENLKAPLWPLDADPRDQKVVSEINLRFQSSCNNLRMVAFAKITIALAAVWKLHATVAFVLGPQHSNQCSTRV